MSTLLLLHLECHECIIVNSTGGGQEGASPPQTLQLSPQMFLCLCCIVYSKMLTLAQIWGYKAFEQTFPPKYCRALCMHKDVIQPKNVAIYICSCCLFHGIACACIYSQYSSTCVVPEKYHRTVNHSYLFIVYEYTMLTVFLWE